MSETRSSRGRSNSRANIPPTKAGGLRWIHRHPLAIRAFQPLPTTPLPSTHFTALNPQDPGPGSSYNSSPNDTSHSPLPTSQTQPSRESIRDEFWLAPLVVLVAIVWLRLALDAMGILPMNWGY